MRHVQVVDAHSCAGNHLQRGKQAEQRWLGKWTGVPLKQGLDLWAMQLRVLEQLFETDDVELLLHDVHKFLGVAMFTHLGDQSPRLAVVHCLQKHPTWIKDSMCYMFQNIFC